MQFALDLYWLIFLYVSFMYFHFCIKTYKNESQSGNSHIVFYEGKIVFIKNNMYVCQQYRG